MRVDVYKNLHNGLMSVRHQGKVITHESTVLIRNPEFVVQPAGRAKVLREQRKNVHAFVRGELVGFSLVNTQMKGFGEEGLRKVSYNPYKAAHFYDKVDGEPVYSATEALVTTLGVWYRPSHDGHLQET